LDEENDHGEQAAWSSGEAYETPGSVVLWPRPGLAVLKAVLALALVPGVAVLLGPTWAVIYLVAAAFVIAWPVSPRRRQGPLRADLQGLHVDGQLVEPRDRLSGGFVAGKHPVQVWMFRPNGRPALQIQVPDQETGQALLAAAKLTTGDRAVVLRLPAGPVRRWLWLLPATVGAAAGPVVIAAAMLGAAVAWVCGALVLLGPFAFHWLGAKRVRIGADGVTVRRVGFERFVPFDAIGEVRAWKPYRPRGTTRLLPRGATLICRDGRSIRLRTAELRVPTSMSEDAVEDYIAQAIRDGAASCHRSTAPQPAWTRQGRSLTEWIRDMRALHAGAEGYRSAGAVDDELWAVLEDAAATPNERAAAAIALAVRADEEAQQRLRAVADATANPPLQEAILAAVAGDNRALERALAALPPAFPKAT
jgi:hypothetical protein